MDEAGKLLIGKGEQPQYLQLPLANRHGLIAGATGTGKTITLQVLAEQFSRAGVPVFCADVKGDLSGIAEPGAPKPKIEQRAAELGVTDFAYAAAPVIFWDLYGEQGHPDPRHGGRDGPAAARAHARAERHPGGRAQHRLQARRRPGPAAARLQGPDGDPAGRGRERGPAAPPTYGNVSKATIGTIQRRLLTLEQQGAEHFFGEPALRALRPDAA